MTYSFNTKPLKLLRRKPMYSLLLWFLRVSCVFSRVDSNTLHTTPKAQKVITPEGFGH